MSWGAARALRDAEEEISKLPEGVICDCCGELVKLTIIDNSRGQGHYKYDIVTECCESTWQLPEEKEVS